MGCVFYQTVRLLAIGATSALGTAGFSTADANDSHQVSLNAIAIGAVSRTDFSLGMIETRVTISGDPAVAGCISFPLPPNRQFATGSCRSGFRILRARQATLRLRPSFRSAVLASLVLPAAVHQHPPRLPTHTLFVKSP